MKKSDGGSSELVWDSLVRVMHWTLVVAFFAAYFTEDELLTVHSWAGYIVGGIVVIRVIWGFIGPRHARFSDFIYSPATIIRNLRDLFMPGGGRRYVGHTPAGGAMVIMLLIALAVTVWSGLELLAIEEGQGPLASANGSAGSALVHVINVARADEGGEGEAGEEFWEEIHEVAANFTLGLVIVHIVGVFLAMRAHRENLIRAMITGRKPRPRDH